MPRLTPHRIAVGSLVALVLLVGVVWWRMRDPLAPPQPRPLVTYCAASCRPAAEAVARDYEADTGRKVELRFGASEDLLRQASTIVPTDPADLFLPADDGYIRTAQATSVAGESIPFAAMRCVLLTAPGNPKGISRWADLLKPGVTVAVPNPAAAAGKLARDHLAKEGLWDALRPHAVDTGTVTEAANASKLGAADAAVVWDAVAAAYPEQAALDLPQLHPVTARVAVAVLTQSPEPDAALRFARYLTSPDHGLPRFRAAGFQLLPPTPPGPPLEGGGG